MADTAKPGASDREKKALEGIAVAPPVPKDDDAGSAGGETPPVPEVREAVDAEDNQTLKEDPSDPDAKLDVALDESFPTSDAPANTRPGSGDEPAPSSGYDEAEEKAREQR